MKPPFHVPLIARYVTCTTYGTCSRLARLQESRRPPSFLPKAVVQEAAASRESRVLRGSSMSMDHTRCKEQLPLWHYAVPTTLGWNVEIWRTSALSTPTHKPCAYNVVPEHVPCHPALDDLMIVRTTEPPFCPTEAPLQEVSPLPAGHG